MKFQSFSNVANCLMNSIKETFYLLILFFLILMGFSRCFELYIGMYHADFSEFHLSFQHLLEYMTNISDFKFFLEKENASAFLILVSFVFVMKFTIVNIFLAIIYKNYQKISLDKTEHKDFVELTIYEFIRFTADALFCKKVEKNNKKCNDLFSQLINKFDPSKVFKQNSKFLFINFIN